MGDSNGKVALVLPSVMASGTERRMAFVYRNLERRYPGEYRLVVSHELFKILNAGGFELDRLPGVRLLPRRHPLDRKRGAHASVVVNLGRLLTMNRYRRQLIRFARDEGIRLFHPYLELVPFLALRPLRGVPWIVPVVDHLPKYFGGRTLDSRLLRRAASLGARVDCLYRWISERMEEMGVPKERLNNPAWNTVNHEAFHPESKDLLVTYAARTIDWKNPLLMVSVIEHVLRRRPDVKFHVLGTGTQASETARRINAAGWEQVRAGYLEDPSGVVNRSLVHVSLDRFDNFPNQSLLEGMAAGCAIVASDVGETHRVVTPDVGVLTSLAADEIADAILRLVSDPPMAEDMGRAGRERVLTNHHVDRYVDYLHRIHDLGRPGRVIDGIPEG